jgi:hypothetical protein
MSEEKHSQITDGSIGAGVHTYNYNTADQETLVVTWTASGIGVAVGNLTTADVKVRSNNGLTLPTPLTPEVIHATTDLGSDVVVMKRYDVRGLRQIEISATTVGGPWNLKIEATSYWG